MTCTELNCALWMHPNDVKSSPTSLHRRREQLEEVRILRKIYLVCITQMVIWYFRFDPVIFRPTLFRKLFCEFFLQIQLLWNLTFRHKAKCFSALQYNICTVFDEKLLKSLWKAFGKMWAWNHSKHLDTYLICNFHNKIGKLVKGILKLLFLKAFTEATKFEIPKGVLYIDRLQKLTNHIFLKIFNPICFRSPVW